jgi:hypothetical protein
MKKMVKIIGITVLFLIVGLVSIYVTSKVLHSKEPNLKINEELTKSYPVLINYSYQNYLVYSNGKSLIDSNSSFANMVPDFKNYGVFCGDVKAELLLYSKQPGNENVLGGSVRVADCGKVYWILESYDTGPKIYGPFEKQYLD